MNSCTKRNHYHEHERNSYKHDAPRNWKEILTLEPLLGPIGGGLAGAAAAGAAAGASPSAGVAAAGSSDARTTSLLLLGDDQFLLGTTGVNPILAATDDAKLAINLYFLVLSFLLFQQVICKFENEELQGSIT